MKELANRNEILAWRNAQTEPIIIVPTMGALHEGHLSLVRRAKQVGGNVLVTIFVNPLQFDKASDLENYPSTLDADLAACRAEGVDAVFTPEDNEFYAADRSITVSETSLSDTLCGATREGHFDGVCTVVLKLFLLSGASYGVFGEKDYQQLAIIRRMVRDLDVPVEIIAAKTVREPDGLAMSSRNTRLTVEARADAPRIREALLLATVQQTVENVLRSAREHIEASELAPQIDYLTLVDAETLQPALDLKSPTVLATAVFYGNVRLIDNIYRDAEV